MSPAPCASAPAAAAANLVDLTQLEIYVNVLGELEYLQSQPPGDGGIVAGDDFYIARDLRPSSPSLCAGGG